MVCRIVGDACGAGRGAALLLLLGFFGMRKRKVVPVDAGRGSIAGAFGDSPFGGPDDAAALSAHDAEEGQAARTAAA